MNRRHDGHDWHMQMTPEFKVGDRVQLHPACDLWMRGARFGTIHSIDSAFIFVTLDKLPGHPRRFKSSDLTHVL